MEHYRWTARTIVFSDVLDEKKNYFVSFDKLIENQSSECSINEDKVLLDYLNVFAVLI